MEGTAGNVGVVVEVLLLAVGWVGALALNDFIFAGTFAASIFRNDLKLISSLRAITVPPPFLV